MTPEEIAKKMEEVNKDIQREAILNSKIDDLVKEIKENCGVADGKELKTKIDSMKLDLGKEEAIFQTMCNEYEALELKVGV